MIRAEKKTEWTKLIYFFFLASEKDFFHQKVFKIIYLLFKADQKK